MKHSLKRHRQLYAILQKKGLMDSRHEIIEHFTDGEKSSSKDLNEFEITQLIQWLNDNMPSRIPNTTTVRNAGSNKMVAKLYYLARQYGYVTYDPLKAKTVVDVDAMNGWIAKYGYIKKPLADYQLKEVPKLVSQFQKVVNSYLQTV